MQLLAIDTNCGMTDFGFGLMMFHFEAEQSMECGGCLARLPKALAAMGPVLIVPDFNPGRGFRSARLNRGGLIE